MPQATGTELRGRMRESLSPLIFSSCTRSWEKSPPITVAINVYGATVLRGARQDLEPRGTEQTHTVRQLLFQRLFKLSGPDTDRRRGASCILSVHRGNRSTHAACLHLRLLHLPRGLWMVGVALELVLQAAMSTTSQEVQL